MKKRVAPFLTNEEIARNSTSTLYKGTILLVEVRTGLTQKTRKRETCGYKRWMLVSCLFLCIHGVLFVVYGWYCQYFLRTYMLCRVRMSTFVLVICISTSVYVYIRVLVSCISTSVWFLLSWCLANLHKYTQLNSCCSFGNCDKRTKAVPGRFANDAAGWRLPALQQSRPSIHMNGSEVIGADSKHIRTRCYVETFATNKNPKLSGVDSLTSSTMCWNMWKLPASSRFSD